MVAIEPLTLVLFAFRTLLTNNTLDAYIVPSQDEHYSEFVADCHQRISYLSGFTGSSGAVIVTPTEALLWTDGRYYLQADQELNLNYWTVMKDGTPGTPSQSEYLIRNLTSGSRVGVDPSLYTKGQWDTMTNAISAKGLTLIPIVKNLVDQIWFERPTCGSKPIFHLEHQYSGINSSDKIQAIRKEMVSNGAEMLVITELDEVAWLLNLRGNDIPTSSLFFSYVLMNATTVELFVNETQLNQGALDYLTEQGVTNIKPYNAVLNEAEAMANSTSSTGKVWINRNTNYALVSRILDAGKLLIKLTPISLMKAIKNEVEVEGYRKALIRDTAALCEFFSWLEVEIEKGTQISETGAADHLHEIRRNRSSIFLDLSFTTISASGANAAVIHYMPVRGADSLLSKDKIFLLDSGAIYYDGTTDITRTVHFGTPTDFEKQGYTRVLKGQIALATAKFPYKTVGHRLDAFARQALWEVGLEYNHGTGHGIGHALNVHEGPFSIGSRYSENDPGLQPNMFTSNEPGFYEDNSFGIRLENIIMVKNATLEHNFQNRGFLEFEDLTLLPYQHKLIDFSILTEEEIKYLNDYQSKTRQIIGNHINANNMPASAYDWLMKETPDIGAGTPTDPTQPSTIDSNPDPTDSTEPSTSPSGASTFSGMQVTIYSLVFVILNYDFSCKVI